MDEENLAAGVPAETDHPERPVKPQPSAEPSDSAPIPPPAELRTAELTPPMDATVALAEPEEPEEPVDSSSAPSQRGFIAEWTVTIILLLFGTTTLVQAFVIPTGSMEDTLLIGDHLLVDKLAYAPAGGIAKHLLPYSDVQRGDIIVFRYPVDIQQTFVKRCIGVPGDRIRLVNKQLILNGKADRRAVRVPQDRVHRFLPRQFPQRAQRARVDPARATCWQNHVQNGEVVVPPGYYFAMGDNRDSSLDSRYWGFVPRDNIIGKPLIIYWSYDAPTEALASPYRPRPSVRSGRALPHQDPLAPDVPADPRLSVEMK